MSDAVVDGYTKIEDSFVDRYLTKDGESVSEAKARINDEIRQRNEQNESKLN